MAGCHLVSWLNTVAEWLYAPDFCLRLSIWGLAEYWLCYVEIKCQLDATDDFCCRSYCLPNMFQAPLCPSSGAREYYTGGNHLYNTLELLMMGIVVPKTCWASNKTCNKTHLLHLVGILFPHINDDARSKHIKSVMLSKFIYVFSQSLLTNK